MLCLGTLVALHLALEWDLEKGKPPTRTCGGCLHAQELYL